MSHKASVLSFFPNSTITKTNSGDGFFITVFTPDDDFLISEFGKTASAAWKNAYTRIYQIWEALVGASDVAKLLVKEPQGDDNTDESGNPPRPVELTLESLFELITTVGKETGEVSERLLQATIDNVIDPFERRKIRQKITELIKVFYILDRSLEHVIQN